MMTRKLQERTLCLNLIGAMVLLAGLGGAFWIYHSAEASQNGILGYERGYDGVLYPIMPDESKSYLRSLETYNGKIGVVADQFRRWFTGLWHGKKLAFTFAVIAILIAFCFFYMANTVPIPPEPHAPDGKTDNVANKR